MANLPRSSTPQPILYKSSTLNQSLINRNLGQAPQMIFACKKLQNINCVQEENKQYGGLFIGDVISIVRQQYVRDNKIGAIISCLGQKNYPVNLPSTMLRMVIDASDSLSYPIHIHFEECFKFIQENRRLNRNVLVHCHAGISRSGAIVCAYLMKKNSWSLDQAFSFLKDKRNRVKPNENFMKQLKEYEAKCLQTIKQRKQLNSSFNLRSSENYQNLQQSRKLKKISMRNSLQDQRFLNPIQNRNRTGYGINQKNSIKPLHQIPSYNNNQKRKTVFDIYKQQEGQKILKDNNQMTKNNDEEMDQDLKKPSFGKLFKNKISQLLGQKTKIPLENQQKNQYERGFIQFVSNQVNLSCM